MQLNLLTFNIHHGKGLDKKVNLSRISKIIKSSNADIIGLNEVDKHFSKRSEYLDQALWLAKDLNMHYVFGSAITIKEKGNNNLRQYGNALLSRFPIVKSRNYPFDFLPQVVEDRALLQTEIKIGDRELSIFVTHLSFAPFLHQKQISFILNKVETNKNLSLIMGDWNMKPYTKSWRTVTKHLKDVNPDHESNYTYPSKRPRVRLDYIFVSKEIEILSAGAIKNNEKASDHLPFMTTIHWQ
jgi:endonuclease/exonuclease/phosphatase family metal-dependent hydrolase